MNIKMYIYVLLVYKRSKKHLRLSGFRWELKYRIYNIMKYSNNNFESMTAISCDEPNKWLQDFLPIFVLCDRAAPQINPDLF